MFVGSTPWRWSTLRWLELRKSTARGNPSDKKLERKKSYEERFVDFSFGGLGDCGGRAVDKRFRRFHGECGAGTGVECRSEDRQLQLWTGDADGGGGNHGDVDQSRRHPAHRGQRRESIQIKGTGHSREIVVHVHEAWNVR